MTNESSERAVVDGRRPRWFGWLVAIGCWALGFFTFVASWMSEYPDLGAIAPAEVDRVMAFLLLDLVLGVVTALVTGRLARSAAGSTRAGLAAGAVALASGVSSWSVPAALVTVVLVAAWPGWRWLAVVIVAVFVAGFAPTPFASWDEMSTAEIVPVLLTAALILALLALFGRWIRQRRELLAATRARAESAVRERAGAVETARAHERTAIARDLHDTLSHRLSVISLHAGALAYRDDLPRHEVQEVAEVIQATAQEAVEELHTALTLLREPQAGTAQPRGIDEMDSIVEAVRAPGAQVDVHADADVRRRLRDLGSVGSVALARCVHEGIANAAKHAPGAPVEVNIRESNGGVSLEVSNRFVHGDRSPLPGGFGLIGLEERIAAAKGEFSAGADAERFVLRAWVPWR